jgi:hypothetical protein
VSYGRSKRNLRDGEGIVRGMEKHANDPNRGMNTKVYLVALLVALIAIFALGYFFLAARGSKDVPKANRPNPNSRLVVPVAARSLNWIAV